MAAEMLETAPYAPPVNVIDVIQHARKHSLQGSLTSRVLTSIGVPEGNVSRTLATFRFLNLIEEDGECTATFQRLARASDDEYPEQLAQVIREAYKTVFLYVDPSEFDNTVRLNNVFRQHFNPQAQRTRMVRLFLGLCREAGIISGPEPEPRRAKRTTGNKEHAARQTNKNGRVPPSPEAEVPTASRVSQEPVTTHAASRFTDILAEYTICLETLRKLPSNQRWTAKQRARWIQAMTAVVDLAVEVVDEENSSTRDPSAYTTSADDVPF